MCVKMLLFLLIVVAVSIYPRAVRSEGPVEMQWSADKAFFPILGWDPQHGWNNDIERKNGLDTIEDCNFTMGGIVLPSDIPECERLGLKALGFGDSDETAMRDWNDLWDRTDLSDEEIDGKIQAMVKRYGNSEAIIGYYICDEPGASMFPQLAKAVECVKKYAPGKLAYINLFPDYARIGEVDNSQLETDSFEEYLDRFIQEVRPQLVSYDNYRVQASMDMTQPDKAASYYNNLLMVRQKALENGLPFWNIVSSNQIRPYTTIPSPANLAMQAYTTLAAGGRGLTWYTYYARGYQYAPISKEDEKTQVWYDLREINRQVKVLGPIMNRLRSVGVYFTEPVPVENLPNLPNKEGVDIETEGSMMVGEFEGDEGGRYLMVVNVSLEKSAKFEVTTDDARAKILVYSSADGAARPLESVDKTKAYWLPAGQGVLMKIECNEK